MKRAFEALHDENNVLKTVWWQSNHLDMSYAFVGLPHGETMVFSTPEALGGRDSTDTSAFSWLF